MKLKLTTCRKFNGKEMPLARVKSISCYWNEDVLELTSSCFSRFTKFSLTYASLLLLLLRRAPRALESGPSEGQHFLGVGREDSEPGGEVVPKVCCRRTSRLGQFCSQCSSVCGSSLHSGHVGSAAGSRRWAYA